MKLIRKNKKGFTLVELIVVIAILAILALILIPAITGYIAKAEESRLDSSASALYTQAILLHSEGTATTKEQLDPLLQAEADKSGKGDTVTVDGDGNIIVAVANSKKDPVTVTYPKNNTSDESIPES
ncbi:MAG: prepilin-type N-terminal cleavage/methylation domain-containing protein [Erysipelothrix sp.]|nr:prepilin-type N-terminal cleavage/methylation domain-containing protein [Erysipelothrix sp.]